MANEEVELVSETAGKVIEIAFQEGALVKKGALLVKVDAVSYTHLDVYKRQVTPPAC